MKLAFSQDFFHYGKGAACCALIAIIFLTVSLSSTAQIYRWKDAKGITHFSDQPHSTSVIVNLNASSAMPIPNIISDKQLTIFSYEQLQIINPKNDASIFDNQGTVNVSILIQPPLHADDHLILLLDGKQIAKSQQKFFHLKNIDRGTHELQVQVVDSQGGILDESTRVIFHLHRAIVGNYSPT